MKEATTTKVKITIDQLAQMVARGFSDMDKKFDVVFGELKRIGDDLDDLKNTTKTHQQTLMDHEHRLDLLER